MSDLGHDELAPMALGYVQAWLASDSWTVARIADELDGCDPQRVAETFSVIAASLLAEACGSKAKASALVRKRISERVGRMAGRAA
jgi:hypothetical protein